MPHVEKGPPPGLWWYRERGQAGIPTADSRRVVDEYVRRYARGRTLPDDFDKQLIKCLHDLSNSHPIRARETRYWDLKSYARVHAKSFGVKPPTVMKWFREMKTIAAELFPERVPKSQRRIEIDDKKKEQIRARYVELRTSERRGHIEALAQLAASFRITATRAGQICRQERYLTDDDDADVLTSTDTESAAPSDVESPFGG